MFDVIGRHGTLSTRGIRRYSSRPDPRQEETQLNKRELSLRVAEAASLSRAEADIAVRAVFSAVAATLAREERLSPAAFGTFPACTREARIARNPCTGQSIAVAASTVPTFRPTMSPRANVNARTM